VIELSSRGFCLRVGTTSNLLADDRMKSRYTLSMFNPFSKTKETITISPSIVVFTVFFLLGLWLLFYIRSILLLLFMAFILMVALHPLVKKFETHLKLSRGLSAGLAYFIFITFLVLFLALLIPPLAKEMYGLIGKINIPVLQEQIKSFNFTVAEISNIADRVGSSVGVLFQAINVTFSSIFTAFTLFVLSFYLMVERRTLHQKIYWFSKAKNHIAQADAFLNSIELQLGGWVRGELILMFAVGTLNYVGLLLLGVPYALPLALVAGFLEILPNLGPILSTVLASLIALTVGGPFLALGVAVMGIVIQQVENSFLVPKVMSVNANVNSLTSILSILIGLQLGGIAGGFLAIPAYIVMRSVYSTFFQHRT
jgi:predicted PurR-regulated permease PerM